MHMEDLLIELIILTITPFIVRTVRAYIHGHSKTDKDHTPGEESNER